MSTTKRINQKKVDQIGYQRGRWAIYLFLAIVVVCQLLPFYLAINASMKPQTDMSSTLMPRLHDIAWDNWTAAITDGQIFLESDLFNSGMRPAVNVGLSVSRVGGAAQAKAMKKAAGSVRIDLAQYREMEIFTQFSSDLDEATTQQLKYGSGLMELLKQPLSSPLSLHEQVITLCAATHKAMMHVETKKMKKYQRDMLDYFDSAYPEIGREIEEKRQLPDELAEKIVKVAEEFADKSR